MEEYTVDYFINKFEAIPEALWCVGSLEFIDNDTQTVKCCALGHCGVKLVDVSLDFINTDEGKALIRLFGGAWDEDYQKVYEVNDNQENYGTTPKERILYKLKQIKEKNLA